VLRAGVQPELLPFPDIQLDTPRFGIDDPVFLHARLRIVVALLPEIQVGRRGREHLDDQVGRAFDMRGPKSIGMLPKHHEQIRLVDRVFTKLDIQRCVIDPPTAGTTHHLKQQHFQARRNLLMNPRR